ncbi:hypothetical protein VTL71DRAFT_1405 [Oculimacula yallundae]|uniref:Uncharacterized protein n=1 Tax=Oculimacula yallundae TaxID=86028 RepID=A0ABR4CBZ2_9HELO
MTSLTPLETNSASLGAAMANPNKGTWESLPYDLRFMMWLATHKDESRVVLADSTMVPREELSRVIPTASSMVPREETSSSTAKAFKRKWKEMNRTPKFPVRIHNKEKTCEAFTAGVFSDKLSAMILAQTFFGPEVKQDPGFMEYLFGLNSVQKALRHSKNIYFIPDLRKFASAMVEAERRVSLIDYDIPIEERMPHFSLVFGWELESVAIEAWKPTPDDDRGDKDFLKSVEYLVEALYDLPNLKTIYVVQKTIEDPRTVMLHTPRFTRLALRKNASVESNDQTKARTALNAEDVQNYQNTSVARSIIQRAWSNYKRYGHHPCPDIRIVAWDVKKEVIQQ